MADEHGDEGHLVEDEQDQLTNVSFKDFRDYFKYSMGDASIVIMVFFCLLAALCLMATLYWISHWTSRDYKEQ